MLVVSMGEHSRGQMVGEGSPTWEVKVKDKPAAGQMVAGMVLEGQGLQGWQMYKPLLYVHRGKGR